MVQVLTVCTDIWLGDCIDRSARARELSMDRVSKQRAAVGTLARVAWCDVTSWNVCGWEYIGRDGVYAVLRKV